MKEQVFNEKPQEPVKTEFEDISSWDKKNYYERLGVPVDADPDQIKKAFRKLSVKFHPDKFQVGQEDPLFENYTEVFKRISVAHDDLGNPLKRSKYDLGLKNGFDVDKQREQSTGSQNPMQKFQEDLMRDVFKPSNKKEFKFNKKEEIRDFIKDAQEHLKKRPFGNACMMIKNDMSALEMLDVKKEDILKVLEGVVLKYFIIHYKITVNTAPAWEIDNLISGMESLGFSKDKLESVLNDLNKDEIKENLNKKDKV